MARVRDLWKNARTGEHTARYGTGKRWQAEWVVDGATRTLGFDRKVDAERHLATAVTAVLSGSYVDPAAGRITVEAYTQRWLAEHAPARTGSRDRYRSHLDVHIVPALGRLPIGLVRRAHVQRMVTDLSALELAPGTVHSIVRTTQIVFRAAVRDQVIPQSPCAKLALPEPGDDKAVPLTVGQVRALAAVMPERYAALVLFGAATGLRSGELFGLEVDPRRGVDFLRRRVLVRQQLLCHTGRKPYLGKPKTPKSVRDVPVGPGALRLLAEHLERFPARELEIVDESSGRPRTRTATFAFLSTVDTPIRRATFSDNWARAVRRADEQLLAEARTRTGRPLRAEEKAALVLPERAVPHSLRHTYVSTLIAHGAHPKTIQERVGHKSIVETMDTYGHLFEDQDDMTRAAIDTAFGWVNHGGDDARVATR